MAYKPNTKEDILNDPYFSQSTQGGQYIQQNIDEIFNLAQAGKFYSNAEIRNLSEGLGNSLSFYQGRQTQEEVNAAADASGLAGRKLAEQHNPASQYYIGSSADGGITGGRAALDAALASGEQPIKTAPTEPGETGGTPSQNLYIGATNWETLKADPKYSLAQLDAATYLSNGDRYWNPNVSIEKLDKSGKPISSTGVISADTADENVSDVNLGGTSYDQPESETYTSKGESMANNITEILNSIPETPEQEQYADITQKLVDSLGMEEGKSAALAEELATPGGYNTLKEQLTESRNALNTLIAEKNAYNQGLEGQTVSKSRINAKNAYYNSKITLQTSLANALVGNVNQALDEAENSVAIKYGAQEDNIAMYQAQLNALAPLLSSQEKKQSMIQQVLIDEYISGLNIKKQEEMDINALAVNVTANTGDKKLGDMIAASGSLIDAAALAGDLATSEGWQYVGTPQERDQLISQGYEITQSGGRTYARPTELMGDLLSPSEAKTLGVAYGTTRQQAIDQGITPRYVGTGGGGTPVVKGFKFSSDDVGRLLNVGFNQGDLPQIESDINEFGIDATVAGLDERQVTAIRNIASGVTPTQERALEEPEPEPKITEGKRKVIGGVNALMADNASNEEIKEYIELKGYTKEDFADLLSGYTPTVSQAKWWEFWK